MLDIAGKDVVGTRWRAWVRTAALLLPLATCAVLATMRDSVTSATAVLVLVVWVVAAAATGDRIAGVLAALSGGAWFDFFLTEPYHRFTVDDADDIEAMVLLIVIGLVVTEVALWGRRQQAQASRRSGYLDGVLSAAAKVAEGDAPRTTIIDLVAQHITEVLGGDRCKFVDGQVHDPRNALLDHDGALTRGGHEVNVDRDGLPVDEYVAVPVHRGARVLGHFLVTSASHVAYPSLEQRRIAVLLADQVAVVLEGESA